VTIPYFAVSLPDFLVFDDDLGRRNELHCRYMIALGCLGLGRIKKARSQFDHILALDCNHLGALVHRPLSAEPNGRQQGPHGPRILGGAAMKSK